MHKAPYMRHCAAIACVFAALAAAAASAETNAAPTAAELLDKVLAGMPHTPVQVDSRIAVKTGSKRTVLSMRLRMTLCISPEETTGLYVFADTSDVPFAELNVKRKAGSSIYGYRTGNPLTNAAMPGLSEPVQGTDITWMDLAMPFLWWRDGEVLGGDTTRGIDCWVVRVRPPAGEAGYEGSVKVWIDRKHFMVLRAEQFNAAGEKTRYMVVESFKKIDDEWMIKDIIVKRTDTRASTVITVANMKALGDDPASGDRSPPQQNRP